MFPCRKVLWLCIRDKEKVASGRKSWKKISVSVPPSRCEWKTTFKSTKCKCTWPQGNSVWWWRADVSLSWEELMSWPITVWKVASSHTWRVSLWRRPGRSNAGKNVTVVLSRSRLLPGVIITGKTPTNHWAASHHHQGERVCSGQLDCVRITQQLGRKNRKTTQSFISVLDWEKTWNEVLIRQGDGFFCQSVGGATTPDEIYNSRW